MSIISRFLDWIYPATSHGQAELHARIQAHIAEESSKLDKAERLIYEDNGVHYMYRAEPLKRGKR